MRNTEFWLKMNRRAINEIDREIGKLIGDRIKLARHTMELKSEAGLETRDLKREIQCAMNAQAASRDDSDVAYRVIEAVYVAIFETQI